MEKSFKKTGSDDVTCFADQIDAAIDDTTTEESEHTYEITHGGGDV